LFVNAGMPIVYMAGKLSNSFLYGDHYADTCDSAGMLGHLGWFWVMSAARIAQREVACFHGCEGLLGHLGHGF
jgi:hypothetical protein